MATDTDGVDHSIVIMARDPHRLESSCPAGGSSPCLADGSLSVVLDGEETLFGPGSVILGEDVEVSAVNLPGACRSFGFEEYWERKKLENARHGRRLQSRQQSMAEWILGVSGGESYPTSVPGDDAVQGKGRHAVVVGIAATHPMSDSWITDPVCRPQLLSV